MLDAAIRIFAGFSAHCLTANGVRPHTQEDNEDAALFEEGQAPRRSIEMCDLPHIPYFAKFNCFWAVAADVAASCTHAEAVRDHCKLKQHRVLKLLVL